MLYQKLRILAFMVTALARLSTAATFTCDRSPGYVECTIFVSTGNEFRILEGGGWGCTDDGQYCAEIQSATEIEVKFEVENGARACTSSCNLTAELKCQIDAC